MFRTLAAFAVATACSPTAAGEPAELTSRERGDLAIHARAILKQYCSECHGGGKSRGTLNVLDHKQLVATGNPVPFVAPGNVTASQVVQLVEEGSMPPGGVPRPTPEDVAVLKQWVAEKAPSFPMKFDDSGTLDTIAADAVVQGANAGHMRYFSLAHLVGDKGLPDLNKAEADLGRAFAALGIKSPPEPVDDTATLFRFDVRTAGWDNREIFNRFDGLKNGGVRPLDAYDVLLLEYPHAVPAGTALDDYFAKAKLVRPVPFLRADWVSGVILDKTTPTPLADDLKALTQLGDALKQAGFPTAEDKMPCGLKPRAFGGRDSVPPVAKSALPPLSAWYSGDIQTAPPLFNLAVEVSDADGKPLKTVAVGQPFQLRVSTKKNVQFALLQVLEDGSVRVQPTNKGGLFDKDENVVTPTEGAPFKITSLEAKDTKVTIYFVLLASESPLPPVTIIRSRHSEGLDCLEKGLLPVSRFLLNLESKTEKFDPTKFDPTKVVRKVIPVTITTTKMRD